MHLGVLNIHRLLFAATATLLLLSGCETSVELDTPPFAKELVVYAHIEAAVYTETASPPIRIYLSHTRSPGSNEVFVPIGNASFRLSKDGMPAEPVAADIVNPHPGNYTLYELSTGTIQPGSTYKIEISTGGDYPDITTETLVPHTKPDITFEYFNQSPDGGDIYKIVLDDEPSADFYQVALEAYDTDMPSNKQVIQFSVDTQSEINCFPVNDAASYPLGGGHLFDDKSFAGQEKEIFIHIPKEQFEPNDIENWKYQLSLSKVSQPFYQFNKIVAQQNGTFPIPIFSNPPAPYTNVENGYGCFSAQYVSTVISNKYISE